MGFWKSAAIITGKALGILEDVPPSEINLTPYVQSTQAQKGPSSGKITSSTGVKFVKVQAGPGKAVLQRTDNSNSSGGTIRVLVGNHMQNVNADTVVFNDKGEVISCGYASDPY